MDSDYVKLYESVAMDEHDYQVKNQYHHFRRVELGLRYLSVFQSGMLVLDAGCGDGVQAEMISRLQHRIIGVDISKTRVKRAKGKAENVLICDLNHLPFRYHSFDLVYMGQVIEHLPTPSETLLEIGRISKDKRFLILDTPSRSNFIDIILKFFWRISESRWLNHALKWGLSIDRTHRHFYNMNSFSLLLISSGFAVLDVKGGPFLRYDIPLIGRLAWQRNEWGLYMAIDKVTENIPVLSRYGAIQVYLCQKV